MMKKLFNLLLDLFFPPMCVACKIRLAEGEEFVCLHCLAKIPRTNQHLEDDNKCEQLFAGRFPFSRAAAYAYFVKGGSMQAIIHELKYRHNPDIGRFAGRLCGTDLDGSPFLSDIDCIVPVPLHPKRKKTRGYNQSEEIARGLSESTGLLLDADTLKRSVNNDSQTKKSKTERWLNVENIFCISDPKRFEGKHILLVDDVITTGATIEACAKELLKCDGCRVSILGLASADVY